MDMLTTKKERTAEILKKVGRKPTQSLVVSELLEQLMAVWGGPQQFAAAFFTEFRNANSGGVVRARMLSDVFRLFQAHTAAQKGPANAVEGMSDEELTDALKDMLNGISDPAPTP